MEQTEQKRRQSWSPFLRLLKRAKLPWKWYILHLVLSLCVSTINVKLPQMAGQIMSGNFDKGVVATYSLVQLGTQLAMASLTIFSTWIALNMDRVLQHSIWKRFLRLPIRH